MDPKTVLLVDDEPHVTHVMSLKLQAAGLRVLVATDGQEALRVMASTAAHLVVTDFQMPAMTGYDLALSLRQNARTAHVPVLMITARGHMLSPEEIARTGIRDVICKPFSPRLVLERVLMILTEDASHGAAAA